VRKILICGCISQLHSPDISRKRDTDSELIELLKVSTFKLCYFISEKSSSFLFGRL
jgi:hypothetical protein